MNLMQFDALHAAALWSGLLVLLLVSLSGVVVRRRRRHQISFGDAGNAEMTTAARAFGNAAEYIPIGVAALILLALLGVQEVLIHAVGGGLLAGRILHALGLLFQKKPGLGRVLGMTLTWIALIVAGVALIGFAVI